MLSPCIGCGPLQRSSALTKLLRSMWKPQVLRRSSIPAEPKRPKYHIYACMFMYMCIHICVCIQMYIDLYACIYMIYVCIYIYMCTDRERDVFCAQYSTYNGFGTYAILFGYLDLEDITFGFLSAFLQALRIFVLGPGCHCLCCAGEGPQ